MAVYKGWNVKIYKDGVQIGYCSSASVEVSTGLEPFFELGSRWATDLTEGNNEITGSFSKAWVNVDYLNLLVSSTTLNEFDLCFETQSSGGGVIYLYDCKFERGSVDIPQDGVLTEDYDFQASSLYFTVKA